MNKKNQRTFSGPFLLALIFVSISGCQTLAMQQSPASSSPIQNSQIAVSSATPSNGERTANIVIAREEGNLYNISWPTIPGAAYYKLFLNGELLKDQLKNTQDQVDISKLSWGIHKLGYEAFDKNNRFMGYLAQEWDLTALLPKPPEPVFPPCPTIDYFDADPWVNKFCWEGKLYESPTEKNFIEGKIYTDNQTLLAGTTITLRLYESSHPFVRETNSTDGTFYLDMIPTGFKVEIFASKPGYTTRRRVEIVKSKGQPNENRYDFGTEGENYIFSAPYNALSDKPEVTFVKPARNGSGLSPTTDFKLHFSEPVDRKSVEETFTVRSFNSRLLSVDGGPLAPGLIDLPIPHTLKGNGTIASNFLTDNSTPIYDSSAFDIIWNADDTQVTFTFKDGKALPTDKDKNSVPDYNIAFKSFNEENRIIKDKSGIERKEKHFKLTDGDFEESYKFSILPDVMPPTLESAQWTGATAQTATISLKYSEPMLLKTHSLNISGGMAETLTSCKQAPAGYPGSQNCISARAAQNYQIKITGANSTPRFEGNWSQLGGKAEYNSQDPTQKIVKLSLTPYLGPNRIHYFAAGQILLTESGRYQTGNFQNVFSFLLDKIDGTQTKVEVSLTANLTTGESLSQDLMVKLNQKLGEMGSSARFKSSFIADPGFHPGMNAPGRMSLSLVDAQSDHLGFSALAAPEANSRGDHLPNFQVGGRTLQTGQFLFDFQAGDQLEITAVATIVDPAGNPLLNSKIPLKVTVP